MPTVTADLEYLARVVESDTRGRLGGDAEWRTQTAWELRHPTVKTLTHNVKLLLWCDDVEPPARWAAQRLKHLIDSHTRRQLAALLAA